ncbi:hypothetical protein RB195_010325 [Necator americanus]|uniref:Uncharacterized protein n=1 Tax=Necator americanus TaxID=51031 RepID=A0ABR1CXE6_NECAM
MVLTWNRSMFVARVVQRRKLINNTGCEHLDLATWRRLKDQLHLPLAGLQTFDGPPCKVHGCYESTLAQQEQGICLMNPTQALKATQSHRCPTNWKELEFCFIYRKRRVVRTGGPSGLKRIFALTGKITATGHNMEFSKGVKDLKEEISAKAPRIGDSRGKAYGTIVITVYGRVADPFNDLQWLADVSSQCFYPPRQVCYQFVDTGRMKDLPQEGKGTLKAIKLKAWLKEVARCENPRWEIRSQSPSQEDC